MPIDEKLITNVFLQVSNVEKGVDHKRLKILHDEARAP
jgi:hypothetical protein